MIIQADSLQTFPLADGSVQMCVTSPPYLGLRDYGISGQLGLEPTVDEFVQNMVQVFRNVWRVLRDDGTLWLNLGDSYNSKPHQRSNDDLAGSKQMTNHGSRTTPSRSLPGVKPKDLLGIPWRVAFALQADGWYLRSEITWAKKAPMPESVTDRPANATEKVFLLSKQPNYFFDMEAVKEPKAASTANDKRDNGNGHRRERDYVGAPSNGGTNLGGSDGGRNMRNWWLLGPEPYPQAHFATFPTEVPRRCILAGTSAHGACSVCGAPWERVVEREPNPVGINGGQHREVVRNGALGKRDRDTEREKRIGQSSTLGFAPTCAHADAPTVPCIVLDPFAGSCTTGEVARLHGRKFVGLDLNMKYLRELGLPRAEMKNTAESIRALPLFAAL